MKLMLGEHRKIVGYTTIDIHGTPDIMHDLNKPLPLPDESVEQMEGYHLLEHLLPPPPIADWRRVLKKDGLLILETPDIAKIFPLYITTEYGGLKHLLLQYVYGCQDREGQYHYWGYDEGQLRQLFNPAYWSVDFTKPQDYHSQEAPCIRVEAKKL